MNIITSDLDRATRELPPTMRVWVAYGLTSGMHRIAAFSYENDLTVCPIAAAAKSAGIWVDGGIAPGHPEWGTPDEPSEQTEEFAARFDICTREVSIDVALATVREALGIDTMRDAA